MAKSERFRFLAIRDRVVQGAVKLILEGVFEADFCTNSYGFRSKRSPHVALAEVRRSVLRRKSTVIDLDLSRYFDTIQHSVRLDKIAQRIYEAVNYHRFADDIVITISGHPTKRGWAERALQRVREQFALIGVELNQEKTKVVDALKGEAFGFLGFDLRRVRQRNGEGYFIWMTPKKKAVRQSKQRSATSSRAGAPPPCQTW
jgi:hypothetical protein